MTIGEVSKRAQIPASTLRYYETLNLLPEVLRENGRRVYDDSVFPKLRFIDAAKMTGFSLAEIRAFVTLSDVEADWQPLVKAKLAEIDATIENLCEMKRTLTGFLERGCAEEVDS